MKKIIALVAGIAMSMTAVFAEHTVGLGFNIPVNSLKVEDTDVSEHGFGFDLTYLFIHENGFSAKADAALNIMDTDDIPSDGSMGNFVFDLGAGYTFLNKEKFTVSVLGMLGMTLGGHSKDYEIEDHKVTYDCSWLTFDIGADVIGKYKFTDHFGAFVNLGLRYAINMKTNEELEFEDSDVNELFGYSNDDLSTKGIRFQPTLGVCWSF